jgi:hypothetical protein
VVGLPPEFVAYARTQPFWQRQEELAHTLAYDATIMGDYSLPAELAAAVSAPTLVMAGGGASRSCARRRGRSRTLSPMRRHASWKDRSTT